MQYKRFPLGALWTNAYLFWSEKNGENTAFLVDPGGDPQDVLDFMSKNKIKLDSVLLTHGHLDHTAGLQYLTDIVGDKIYVGKGDAYRLKTPSRELQMMLRISCPSIENFHELSDGDKLNIAGFDITVLETPGHTEGGLCFLILSSSTPDGLKNGESVLVSGDTLFAQSVGRTDLEGGDAEKLENSLRRLANFPDDLKVLPGHGPETKIGEERRHNPFWPR